MYLTNITEAVSYPTSVLHNSSGHYTGGEMTTWL